MLDGRCGSSCAFAWSAGHSRFFPGKPPFGERDANGNATFSGASVRRSAVPGHKQSKGRISMLRRTRRRDPTSGSRRFADAATAEMSAYKGKAAALGSPGKAASDPTRTSEDVPMGLSAYATEKQCSQQSSLARYPRFRYRCAATADTYRNRRLSRLSWLSEVQPISLMSRSISARSRPRARSTPARPAAASAYR